MSHLPEGQYLSRAQAKDKYDYNDIANFIKDFITFNQKQSNIHLAIILKYLSNPVFEEIRVIFYYVYTPANLKIMIITNYLTQDAEAKKPIAIQMIVN